MYGDVIQTEAFNKTWYTKKFGNLNECVSEILHGLLVCIDMHNYQNNVTTKQLIAKL